MDLSEHILNRRRGKPASDLFKLDIKNRTPEENIRDIIQGLYVRKSTQNDTSPSYKTVPTEYRSGFRGMHRSSTDSRKLAYLNALVTLLCKEERSNLGFTPDELMACLRISLVDESMVIRAAALRVIRHLLKTDYDVTIFNNMKLPYLVVRSMEVIIRNEEERAQAMRVARRACTMRAAAALLRCLAALAADPTADRLSRPAVATLAEISVVNPELWVWCGGASAVSRQLAECATPRQAEALCGALLHVLDRPGPRRAARLTTACLTHLAAPYCDFHFRSAPTDSTRDEREMRFTCSRLALLCVLRSWPGLLHFCHPSSAGGLRSLVAALYLPRLEVRKAILDLLYELVGLPQPEWTDEISVALDAVDPSDFQDTWRLNEGFVAAEGIAILPHLAATGPDITENHLALLLQCFLEVGLLDGLAEVIVTSDTFISVRATVLLGQLLHLVHLFLPPPICNITPALPVLMSQASNGKPQALAAVAALRKLHAMLEARPASSSLFLDHIIQYCSGAFKEKNEDAAKSRKEKDNANIRPRQEIGIHKNDSIELLNESDNENETKQRHSVGSRNDVTNRNISALVKSKSVTSRTSAAVSKVAKSAKFFNLFERDSDSLIRSTLVMQNKDGNTWNWEIIRTILKENDTTPFFNLNDSGHKAWATRIVNYLKPSSNKYSHMDLSSTCYGHSATRAGCQLIRHLLRHNDVDCHRLLEDLFLDVSNQIKAIETGVKAHECLFSPQHMCNTMCQMYFLFIGQLCHSYAGLKLFKQTGLYENLLELSTKTHHSCYVKLIISSLDYTLDSYPRDILSKTLTCSIQASRLYATQFLNVLMRASRKSKELVRRKTKLKKNTEESNSVQKDDIDNSGVDMETWFLQMLVGQMKDEFKGVVKVALSILEEAFSVPIYVEKLMPMRETLCQNCRLNKNADPATYDLSAVGDRGYLLWLTLEVTAAAQAADAKSMAFLKKHLDFWTKSYNYRYTRVVEAGAHEALAVSEWGGGRGARSRRSARVPPHVHAALAPRPRARHLLHAALLTHYKILQRKKCNTEQEIADLKASLWALGNTATAPSGLQLLMSLSNGYLEDSVLVHVVRLVKYCPVYSIRATAFYVLGLIGCTYDGANLLTELGWLCVRHTRHDQFPVIPDQIYSMYENGSYYSVTSPDYRANAYDTETSEHSDHTDQSATESLHSDYKHATKVGSISEQANRDVVDGKLAIVDTRKEQEKRKSHTLPSQGCSSSHDRPMLSESRTVDILRDCSNYDRPGVIRVPAAENRLLIGRMNSLEHAHEGRVRNTSESSTSGVSSCDSFLGKYTMPDRVLTLSPIPSSSSLYGTKGTIANQRPKIPELQRRTSTSSFSGPEVTNSPPTQMDMTGYATLKSLNRRPHLSESAASCSSEIDDLSWLLSDTNLRSKPFSSLRDRTKSSKERMAKLSVLEYDWRPLAVCETGVEGAEWAPRRAAARPPPPPPHTPPYIGICLPRDLLDIFPENDEIKEDDTDKNDSNRGRISSFLADTSVASVEKYRTTPDLSKNSKDGISGALKTSLASGVSNSTKLTKQDPGIESTITTKVSNVERKNIVSSVKNVGINTVTEAVPEENINQLSDDEDSSAANANVPETGDSSDRTLTEDNVTSTKDVPLSENVAKFKWQHSSNNCLACVRTRPPSSYELREAFFAALDKTSTSGGEPQSPIASITASVERSSNSPETEVLRQVHLMANPIHLKQTRSMLLSLKQKHSEVFRSPCVYSDVCALLSRDTYMLCARRFLQEMFLDTSFECFSSEPAAILARHGAPPSPVTTPTEPIK